MHRNSQKAPSVLASSSVAHRRRLLVTNVSAWALRWALSSGHVLARNLWDAGLMIFVVDSAMNPRQFAGSRAVS
jgi:hypothetical protein